MADYINKNILCQAYIHVEPENWTEADTEAFRLYIEEFTRTRSDFFLYKNPEVEVKTKDGSLIVYATILGTIGVALFKGVQGYPKFREGALLLYEDAKRLSEYITSEGLFATKARHNQIVRVEARTGVIGSVKKIINDLDFVREMNGKIPIGRLATKLKDINEDVDRLIENLNSADDIALVKSGFLELVDSLAANPSSPPKRSGGALDSMRYKLELKKLKSKLN